MAILRFINSFDIVGLLSTIIVIIQTFKKIYLYISDKQYIKTALLTRHKTCYISQSIFIFSSEQEPRKFVTLSSVKSYQKLSDMLYAVGVKAIPCFSSYEGNDIIHIGGPASNVNVNSLFVTKYKKIKFCTTINSKINHEQMELNTNCIEYGETKQNGFKIGNHFLPLDEKTNDYGIFIRIPYDKGLEYTTHIIFAGWSDGTRKAVEFFTKNYKMISKRFKKAKYCFAIPISRINNSFELIESNNIIDLTNDFFNIQDE